LLSEGRPITLNNKDISDSRLLLEPFLTIPNSAKFLVIEDDPKNGPMWHHRLSDRGYEFDLVENGQEGLEQLNSKKYDVLIIDWTKPHHNGIDFIKQVRQKASKPPLILLVTAHADPQSDDRNMDFGADYSFSRPLNSDHFFSVLEKLPRILHLDPRSRHPIAKKPPLKKYPPCVGAVIGASTGGIVSLKSVLKDWPKDFPAAFFIVQHGPQWMLENLPRDLEIIGGLKSQLAVDQANFEPGTIYVAPAGTNLCLTKGFTMRLQEGPKENFVIPAADPLFRSAAEIFGNFCIGLILSGLGNDGTQGAAQIHAAGGSIWAQDPATALAPTMPRVAIQSGVVDKILPLETIRKSLEKELMGLSQKLDKEKHK